MTDTELIEIIDHPKYRGTIAREDAVIELQNRALGPEIRREVARKANEAIAYSIIINDDLMRETVSMHESEFLSREELREIYLEQLEKYILYKDQFRFDVWAYAIGGV